MEDDAILNRCHPGHRWSLLTRYPKIRVDHDINPDFIQQGYKLGKESHNLRSKDTTSGEISSFNNKHVDLKINYRSWEFTSTRISQKHYLPLSVCEFPRFND